MRPAVALAGLLLAACAPENPPVGREIRWADPETEALARRACYDCHSNETHWPWYTSVPGLGAVIAGDVRRGRCHMNFSRWDGPNEEAEEAPEKVLEREMPLETYLLAHGDARLDDAERARLAAGFRATFAADPPLPGEACED